MHGSSPLLHWPPLRAAYLEDDEDVDAGQDDPGNGHLRLHTDKERLVGHGQRHHLVVLQEGLDGDDNGVAAGKTGSGDRKQQQSITIVCSFLTWPIKRIWAFICCDPVNPLILNTSFFIDAGFFWFCRDQTRRKCLSYLLFFLFLFYSSIFLHLAGDFHCYCYGIMETG